jgi:hypothetical protein
MPMVAQRIGEHREHPVDYRYGKEDNGGGKGR